MKPKYTEAVENHGTLEKITYTCHSYALEALNPGKEIMVEKDLYVYLRDKRGYDAMDEYIRRDFLKLSPKDFTATEELVSECASRVHNTLMHQDIEPGTKEAFLGYVACLHQLYLYGVAVQLKRMGYHMTRI